MVEKLESYGKDFDETVARFVGDLLRDPEFVRANWIRGGINCDLVLADDRRMRTYEMLKMSNDVLRAWPEGTEGRKAVSQVMAVLFPEYMQEKAKPT